MDLYGNQVDYYETFSMGNDQSLYKAQKLDDTPFKKLNYGILPLKYLRMN
mgnify:CR=1 FL=1